LLGNFNATAHGVATNLFQIRIRPSRSRKYDAVQKVRPIVRGGAGQVRVL
jgi:hypothetical protein